MELTERISSTKLSWWKARLPGERSRAALIAGADKSAFLALPAAEVPATAPPDPAARRQMISRTIDYLSRLSSSCRTSSQCGRRSNTTSHHKKMSRRGLVYFLILAGLPNSSAR